MEVSSFNNTLMDQASAKIRELIAENRSLKEENVALRKELRRYQDAIQTVAEACSVVD